VLPEILKEEMGHVGFGTNQTAEMALKGGEQQEKIQKSVDFLVRQGPRHVRSLRLRTLESLLSLGFEAPEQYSSALGF